ncbi:MAG: hypothetical protein M3Y86_02210 [Verrucomicrobiota bacterium]|nr:hypothetical protein [Verrucomicrobiota bacterium]
MTITNKYLLVATLAAGLLLPTAANAIGFNIEIGDRGYYTHGARYYDGDWEYIWVPGHRHHGHWVHGYYRRGEHRRHWHHDRDWRDDHDRR